MNIRLTLFFLLIFTHISWCQNQKFEIRIILHGLSGEASLIQEIEYNKAKISDKLIEITPLSELEITKKFADIFKLKDSCYIFNTISNHGNGRNRNELRACKFLKKEERNSNYEFKGIYCQKAIIEITGYESWGYITVDLKDGLAFYTMGKPLTSTGKTAISYSNYYGEEEIALTDLKHKKQYVIGIDGWRTIECKVLNDIYYLKLAPELYYEGLNAEIKYLKVKVNN